MKKKLKKIFNLYNLAIIGCIVVIIVSLIIIFEPDFSGLVNKINTSFSQDIEQDEEITEKQAKKIALKKFKELGEKDINTNNLEVLKISRQGEEYYYISSKENTLEVKIKGGNITRINSVKVD